MENPFSEIHSPREWEQYITSYSRGLLEIVPFTLYDTCVYISGNTVRLDFFNNPNKHRCHTNVQLANVLPNPQSLLIESIRIHGITTNLQYGCCQLDIGNKRYIVNPAWTFALKEKGLKLIPNLMIAPLQYFTFKIEWEIFANVGKGLSGREILYHPIQVCFIGKLARAVC